MTKTEHQIEVRKVHPNAVCKKIGVDNGHSEEPKYAVFKVDSILHGDRISAPVRNAKQAWRHAFDVIQKQNA